MINWMNMTKTRTILLLLTLAMLGMHARSQAQSDEQRIREARLRSNAAIAAKDTNGIAAAWTDDFHIVSSRNSEVSGKDAARHLFATEFQSKKGLLYIRTSDEVKVNPAWNMASETGHWTGTWQEPDGTVRIGGNYFAKWHKVDGLWKIRAEIFVPLFCEGSSFCDRKPF
jgi:ketosteroid isomerase-like protein